MSLSWSCHHDKTEKLLKVVLNTITHTHILMIIFPPYFSCYICLSWWTFCMCYWILMIEYSCMFYWFLTCYHRMFLYILLIFNHWMFLYVSLIFNLRMYLYDFFNDILTFNRYFYQFYWFFLMRMFFHAFYWLALSEDVPPRVFLTKLLWFVLVYFTLVFYLD